MQVAIRHLEDNFHSQMCGDMSGCDIPALSMLTLHFTPDDIIHPRQAARVYHLINSEQCDGLVRDIMTWAPQQSVLSEMTCLKLLDPYQRQSAQALINSPSMVLLDSVCVCLCVHVCGRRSLGADAAASHVACVITVKVSTTCSANLQAVISAER